MGNLRVLPCVPPPRRGLGYIFASRNAREGEHGVCAGPRLVALRSPPSRGPRPETPRRLTNIQRRASKRWTRYSDRTRAPRRPRCSRGFKGSCSPRPTSRSSRTAREKRLHRRRSEKKGSTRGCKYGLLGGISRHLCKRSQRLLDSPLGWTRRASHRQSLQQGSEEGIRRNRKQA